MPITIRKAFLTLDYKRWTFPDCSVGVRLDTANLHYLYATGHGVEEATLPVQDGSNARVWTSGRKITHQTIWARIQSSEDVMELVMVTDALRRFDPTPIHLVMPTLPYARQDRVGVEGEAHSLRAFAAIINALGFEKVTVLDPHSDVTGAVLDRVSLIDPITIFGRFDAFNAHMQPGIPADRPILVSPDAGANKRVAAIAAFYGHSTYVRGDKKRDLATGKLTGFKVYAEPGEIEGRDVMIVDDLIDAGGSFIGLASELRKHSPRRIELYATHGLFTKGVDCLYDGGIDRVWCTDAYRQDLTDPRLTVLQLEQVFNL